MSRAGGISRFDRVRELFDRAIALDPAARQKMLDEACAEDGSLKREVLDLLREDADGSRGLTAPGMGGAWLAQELSGTDEPGSEAPPKQIGEFEILREIGRGGMGIVYEARQREPERRVALKVIHPGLLSPSMLRRFRRETRAMAALKHPGIVQLFEVGHATGPSGGVGQPFLVMELVEGVSLRARARERSWSVNERLALVAMLCDAVHHAHQKGIVHRDLKPDNIVIQDAPARTGVTGTAVRLGIEPKILDFGVSRLMESDETGSMRTNIGQIVGTIPYLSPEQALGDPAATDTRSDVYALGVIAFELLTGKLPFRVEGLPTSAAVQVVLSTPHERLRSIDPTIPRDVQTIVHKAMNRDPAARYPSAAELGADIRRYLAHEPILARAPSWTYVTGRFVRRHRLLAATIAVSGVLVAASVVAMALAWSDATRTREKALWQSYVSAMSAASASVASGDIAAARRQLESTPPQHRGWEFRHLYSRLDQSREVLRSTWRPPLVPVFDADGALILVSADGARRVRRPDGASVYEPLDPRLRIWLAAHGGAMTTPFAWPENAVYWQESVGGPVRSTTLKAWPGWADSSVQESTISRDGSTIAVRLHSASGYAAVVARLSDGEGTAVNFNATDQAARIALNQDGTRLAVATTADNAVPQHVRLIDTRTGAELSRTPPLERAAYSMALAPDGDEVVVALQNGHLERWRFTPGTAEMLRRLPFDQDAPRNLRLSPDGTTLAAGSRDGVLRLFDARSLEPIASLIGHETEIVGVEFDPADGRVVTTGTDGTVRFWDAAPAPTLPLVLGPHEHLVHPVAIVESRREVLVGSWDKTVAVYSLETGARRASVTLDGFVQHAVVSPDERLVSVREFRRPNRLLNLQTLETVRTFPIEAREGDSLPLFDRESRRVTLSLPLESGRAIVGDVATGEVSEIPIQALSAFVGPTLSAAADLIGVSAARDGRTHTVLYRLSDGKEVLSRPTNWIALESMAFSSDGRWFAITGEDNTIDLFDSRTLERLGVFKGHTREVLAMVFSPDGARMFSADLTGVIRIWDTRTFDEVGQLRGHESHIRRLAISKDGRHLVSGSRDGTARVWSVPAPVDSAHRGD